MNKFAKGIYQIKNREKYIGRHTPCFRSSWEHSFMRFLDGTTAILQWASEPFAIPYYDPLNHRHRRYFPDFFIVYVDRNGEKHAELIEIKPMAQTGARKTRSKRNQLAAIINNAKWQAALQWGAKNGCAFRLITEEQMFRGIR
ncbi:Uncharacterised protein [uncultured archaeon]|nr:Uncharacterised protein [uncultured archaeon]